MKPSLTPYTGAGCRGNGGAILNESDRSGLCQRAEAWFKLGDYAKAEEDLREALKISPFHPETLGHMGAISEVQGRTHQAELFYLQSFRHNRAAAHNLSRMLNARGQYREAAAVAKYCLDKFGQYGDCEIHFVVAARGLARQGLGPKQMWFDGEGPDDE